MLLCNHEFHLPLLCNHGFHLPHPLQGWFPHSVATNQLPKLLLIKIREMWFLTFLLLLNLLWLLIFDLLLVIDVFLLWTLEYLLILPWLNRLLLWFLDLLIELLLNFCCYCLWFLNPNIEIWMHFLICLCWNFDVDTPRFCYLLQAFYAVIHGCYNSIHRSICLHWVVDFSYYFEFELSLQ